MHQQVLQVIEANRMQHLVVNQALEVSEQWRLKYRKRFRSLPSLGIAGPLLSAIFTGVIGCLNLNCLFLWEKIHTFILMLEPRLGNWKLNFAIPHYLTGERFSFRISSMYYIHFLCSWRSFRSLTWKTRASGHSP